MDCTTEFTIAEPNDSFERLARACTSVRYPHIASRFEPVGGLGKAEKEISLNQSVDVSNFAQTPDGQRRKSNNNRYASQRVSVFNQ
jgi:hypothetical protein